MTANLTILGASVRAAAHSAVRAGFQPFGIDLFADRDLRAVAEARRIDLELYPDGLESLLPPGQPWMYVGALENHPALIDRMAEIAPLWGNRGDSLRLLRCPFTVRDWMAEQGLVTPRTQFEPPTDGEKTSWLVKPLRSGGGLGIVRWDGLPAGKDRVFQSFLPGMPASALFLGDGRNAHFLGATEQLVGTEDSPFEYVGNIGPLELSTVQADQIHRMGAILAKRAGARGLFGVDLTIDGDQVALIEVNPRDTAAVELLEWSQGRSLLALHAASFSEASIPAPPRWASVRGALGKAILRASEECRLPTRISDRRFANPARRFPTIADIPQPGTTFARGEPVLTVFARGKTAEECRRALQERLDRWKTRLRGS